MVCCDAGQVAVELARLSMIVEELVAGNIQDGRAAAMVSITRRRLRWEQSPAVWLFRCQCDAMQKGNVGRKLRPK